MSHNENTDLSVRTGSGRLQGFLDRGVPNWRGVPYGRVEERFRPARTAASDGDVDATRWGPVSWQVPLTLDFGTWTPLYPDFVESEDCLRLNIWAPPAKRAEPRPVLVWLHPGAHMFGSGNMQTYDPWVFAAHHDVVVVSGNCRLGPWGQLYLGGLDPQFGDSVNLALRDYLLMLEWVRDNIAEFGGDPESVTIFGASSGASDVGTLLGVPAARGLFQRAVVYSGNAEQAVTPDEATALAERFIAAAGSLAATPTDLAKLSNVALRWIHKEMLKDGPVRYDPVVDGEILPRQPLESVGKGMAADVPLLVSVTADEARMFDLYSDHDVDDKYAELPGADLGAGHDEKVDALSKKYFIEPAQRLLAAANAGGGQCWAQVFNYQLSTSPMVHLPALAGRPAHASDSAAIFYDRSSEAENDTDRAVGEAEQAAITGLARNGNPGWERYTAQKPDAKWIGPSDTAALDFGPLPHSGA
ncbi:carboxylesterase family protein [Streptomyces sp. NPDC052101]|uniref:carboxylesterase family protein n=1 Tax=Streptomyces sp. NPDC052101 TaxID=3155763 RepID=UPI00342F0B62